MLKLFSKLLVLTVIATLVFSGTFGCAAPQQQAAPTKGPAQEPTKPAAPAPTPVAAKKVDYPTKEITYIVPVTPGGGFDTMSRILAPFLQKYLPNNPNVIVKNVPGGEWMTGINEVYNAKNDGYTIGIFNLPGNIVNQIMGLARYDLTKVSWIGSITSPPYVAAVSPKSKYKTLDEMKKAPEVKIGAVSLSSSAGLGSLIAAERMGIKPRFVNHKGSSEAILAAIRGDVDFVQYPYGTMDDYVVNSKELIPVWVYSKKRIPTMPDTPTIGELGYPELLEPVSIYYLVGTTPNTPPEILQILREAFDKSMADPDFAKKLQDVGEEVIPAKASEVEGIVKRSIDEYTKYKSAVEKYLK